MEEKKLTDEEIVKAYKYCVLEDGHCNDCPYEDYGCAISAHDILDLINRQKTEIERLAEERENMQAEIIATEEARLQTVKDTAKEILQMIVYTLFLCREWKNEDYKEGYEQALKDYDNHLEKLFKEFYGVEVE